MVWREQVFKWENANSERSFKQWLYNSWWQEVSPHITQSLLWQTRKFSIFCFLDDQIFDGFIFSSSILNISVHLTFLSNNFVKCTNARCAHRSFWLISILQENTFFPPKYVLVHLLSIKSSRRKTFKIIRIWRISKRKQEKNYPEVVTSLKIIF